jgi:hypothetical protein
MGQVRGGLNEPLYSHARQLQPVYKPYSLSATPTHARQSPTAQQSKRLKQPPPSFKKPRPYMVPALEQSYEV